eukprot:m.380814 g.380814  ORF g.380814 m.380814 type:complete len:50 (+) comp20962_c0_seq2:57-206(+)
MEKRRRPLQRSGHKDTVVYSINVRLDAAICALATTRFATMHHTGWFRLG